MLNIEKYKEMLINMGIIDINKLAVVNDKPVKCKDLYKCDKCDFGEEESCESYLEEWLFSEYEEPGVDWSKVKVDTPILVKDCESSKWAKRYFAKFEDGQIYAWSDGTTSWSANDECDVTSWNCAKLAESED
ncbi:hypothetical protein DW018_11620 [Eubacterium ventriosum]|uniref:Uncharacterized protein n=1 Tax=Eubacterium ventriosum TaxID=39496 RepID=A0A415L499_9FIRM|nr:hypothetical protein [Eubacterium ventriosum]RHL43277.1 hypothetical protein DW018_11620 [Eubacterium ventriosum]